MPNFFNLSNWTTEDWALFVSILALVSTIIFNIVSHRNSQNALKLELQKYEEEREEKAKRKLEITISHSNKYERPHLKWLGLWLIVNNRGVDQSLLAEVDVTLYFKEKRKIVEKNSLKSLYGSYFSKPSQVKVGFKLYSDWMYVDMNLLSSQAVRGGFECSNLLPLNFYLLDWDDKKPIYLSPRNEYRMPEPGQKQRWYLFGNIPDKDGEGIKQRNYELHKVRLTFVTDQGIIDVEEHMWTYLLSAETVREYSSFTFEFEKAPLSFFGPNQ